MLIWIPFPQTPLKSPPKPKSFKKRSLDQNYITFRFNWWGGNTDKRLTKLSNQSLGRTPAVVATKIIRATLNNFTNYKSAQLHRSYVRNRGGVKNMNGGIGTQKASYMKKQVQISFGIWINKMYTLSKTKTQSFQYRRELNENLSAPK